MTMVKCRFGTPLKKRLDSRKETETLLKLVRHNIIRVGYPEVMGGVVSLVPEPVMSIKKEGSLGKNSRALGQKRRIRREKIDTGIL